MDEHASTPAGGRPRCPICGPNGYRREAGNLASGRGGTAHLVDGLVCLRRGSVHLVYQGNTISGLD